MSGWLSKLETKLHHIKNKNRWYFNTLFDGEYCWQIWKIKKQTQRGTFPTDSLDLVQNKNKNNNYL